MKLRLKTLAGLAMLAATASAPGQVTGRMDILELNELRAKNMNITSYSTNNNLANAVGDVFVVAGTNGVLGLSPWSVRAWFWVTNAAGGISNSISPVLVLGLNGTVGSLTNGGWLNPTTTNLVNRGNAINSVGSALYTLQLGQSALAQAQAGTAVGYSSAVQGANGTAIGTAASALGASGTALGENAYAGAAANSTALGCATTVGDSHNNSTAVGYGASTTGPNQIMLGSAGVSVVVNNALQVGGGATFANGVTNLLLNGSNQISGDIGFTRFPVTSLANGNNAGVPVGTNVFVEVSGPSGAFTVNGIDGQPNRDGKLLVLLNKTGQTMTIANESGTDPTAANRVTCLTGADKSVTGNSAATLIYSGAASRWILLSFTQ